MKEKSKQKIRMEFLDQKTNNDFEDFETALELVSKEGLLEKSDDDER